MSDSDEQKPAPVPAPKRSRGVMGLVVAVLLAAGSAAAGTVFGPKLLAKPTPHEPPPEGSAGSGQDRPINPTVAFQPIVVDVRVRGEEMHHLKVTLTFELADGVTPEEFEKYTPRGREAAIYYLRSQSYDSITDPKKFDTVTQELSSRVTEAMGKRRIRRVMITDFVTQ